MSSITYLFITLFILASASRSQQYCYPVENIEHGFVKIIDHTYYQSICENGYNLEGELYVLCEKYNQMREKPKCVKPPRSHQNCNPLEKIEHGFVEVVHQTYYTFSCENGYKLEGQIHAYCDEYNQMIEKPKCVKPLRSHQSCNPIEKIEHGFVEIAYQTYYKFSCENGYILRGQIHALCKEYNQMREKPKCVKHVCEDLINPENGLVECDEGPLSPGRTCRFSCFSGYRLHGFSSIICKFNLQWSGSATCSPIPKNSYSEPDNRNRGFHQGTNLGNSDFLTNNFNPSSKVSSSNSCENLHCEQLCLFEKTVPLCRCCPGYLLEDDKRTCRLNNAARINMNECLRRYKKVGDVELLSCPEGSTFDYARKDCIGKRLRSPSALLPTSAPESCFVNKGGCQHECIMETAGTITCKCQIGYELHTDGKHCIDINECSTDKFGCSHSCSNVPGSAFCTCPKGFTLDTDEKTCIDIDECAYENPCQHYCNNTEGSFLCSCKPGYIQIEGYKCEGCRKNSYWSYKDNACVDCPKNSHTDSEGKRSIKDCMCDSGYTGSPGDYLTCEDVDECSINNFNCSDSCVNIPGGAYCLCPTGLTLDIDKKTCIDIDECSIQNGGCEGVCINIDGSFKCLCPEGFTSSNRDHYSCDDIDECSENNGGCEHDCHNYRGGFYCSCKEGYHLDSTLKNCSSYIQCPKLPLPHYSYVDCKYENTSLPEKNSYPAGTSCTFTCNKGFKIAQGSKVNICHKDGTWKGRLPKCKPESCPPLKVPENGKVHPPKCAIHGATIKQKCTFSCNAGYILKGFPVLACKNDKTWNKNEVPVCNPVKIQPVIKCPDDIRIVLLQGTATHNITVPAPISNAEHYEVHPSWVTINESVEFPVGVTQVTFTAISTFNETAQCEMTVTVLDEEPPVFNFCPDPIIIEGAKGSGELVTWDKPIVTDNVELVSVFSLMEPNTTLTPGTYFVEYVARDSSGNIGTCSFHISIIRVNCSDLSDPDHGKANCMDWMFGKLCNPECDDGYMRNPEDPLYFSCDDTGVWEPNNFISECLQYTPASFSTCQDGFELKKVDGTGKEVCIECSSKAVWSPITRKCEK